MLKKLALILSNLVYTLFLLSCDNFSVPKPVEKNKYENLSKLEQIKREGVLNVVTRIDPTTYYPLEMGYTGLEYDLMMLFSEHLGVKINFVVPDNFTMLINNISQGKVDIAAAGLTITEARKQKMRFSHSYQEVTEQIIYKSGTPRPKKPLDLNNGIFEVVEQTSHVESLNNLQSTLSSPLTWIVNTQLDSNEIISLVYAGLIDYTVADSNQIALMRRFYPKLHSAFDISKPRKLAWAMQLSDDNSLYDEVQVFFKKIQEDKTLAQILDRYYGHIHSLNYFDTCTFFQHRKTRLPTYKSHFVTAGKKHNVDWRLLAAIGYQESHWQAHAISPTGVKGIMMLTKDTANHVGIKNRTDPIQSIQGGALYFFQRHKTIPARIPEPDRTWLALASYNIGFGHLEDARILTQKYGDNPDKWMDVREYLPLIAEEPWLPELRYGYARGNEPLRYVENIRNYYDLLIWKTK